MNPNHSPTSQWAAQATLAYIALMGFALPWQLPLFGARPQMAEIIFLGWAPLAWLAWRGRLSPARRWWLPLGLYAGANLLSAVHSGAAAALLEALGRIYLVLAGLLLAAAAREAPRALSWRQVERVWIGAASALAALSLAGYLASWAGLPNLTVREYADYPYFSPMFRLAGLTPGPNMLLLTLCPALLLAWYRYSRGQGPFPPLALLLVAALLTFSKELVLVFAALLVLAPRPRWARNSFLPWLAMGAAALVMLLATHVLALRVDPRKEMAPSRQHFSSDRVLAVWGPYALVGTSYLSVKQANWYIGREHWLLGVGPGQSNRYLSAARKAGIYPDHMPDYDPHSALFGAFSETGLPGLAALLYLCGFTVWRIRRTRLWRNDGFFLCLSYFLLIVLLDMVCKDVMNFRPLWAALGMVIGADVEGNADSRTNNNHSEVSKRQC
jgi:hypothetical protein